MYSTPLIILIFLGFGKCSYPEGSHGYFTGVSSAVFNSAVSCGMCLKVTNPKTKTSVVVHVVDQCISCQEGDLNMNKLAYSVIGDFTAGTTKAVWEQVRCPTMGPLMYYWDKYSDDWNALLQVRNPAYPVQSVEIQQEDGWAPLKLRDDNHWELKRMGSGPFNIKVRGTNGNIVMDNNISMNKLELPVYSDGQL